MYLNRQAGCHTVLIEDPHLPEVYHHFAECYTPQDAQRLARLLMKDGDKVWIQHNYQVKLNPKED